jgi:diacylglycerol kinase
MNRIINSFKFACKGIVVAFKEQRNVRIHLAISVFVMLLAYGLRVSALEWAVLLVCIGMVLGIELVNSAIEALVDLVSPEWKTQAGKVKDLAAGAVLIVALMACLVGLIIFGNHLLALYA